LSKAIAAARRVVKKDKDGNVYDQYYADFETLKTRAFEKAARLVKDDKCSRAIGIYSDIQELFEDRMSNYKKSLCQLKDSMQQKEGFTLLRNSILGIYKDFKEGAEPDKVPEGFALLAKEYYNRNYFFNAEDILRKGVEVFPGDTSVRNEMVRQVKISYTAGITSDLTAGLFKLRNKLLWADSSFSKYAPVRAMLKETDTKILQAYIKYEPDFNATIDFINSCRTFDSVAYSVDSVTDFLISQYNVSEVRRIDGALDNITKIIIEINRQSAEKLSIAPAQYVFNFLMKENNYEVGAYFIRQCKTLYPKDKVMLATMQTGLENKLVELLSAAPKDLASLDMAEKFIGIAPANKKLPEIEKNMYLELLKKQAGGNDYSLFFTTSARGLKRFPGNPDMVRLKKEVVIKDYKENYIPNQIANFGELKVITNIPTCTAGKVDSAANRKYTAVLNYLRRQAGLYDSCFLDAELNEYCQQAALMMKARNDLDHYPDSTWKCYSLKGKRGAGSSNLSLGNFGTNALVSQLEDEGEGNQSVGHRRWILNPYTKVFGHGSTDISMALYVFGKYYNDLVKDRLPKWNKEDFISWPPKDFAPLPLTFRRWSFSLEDADFSKAKVSVIMKGKAIKQTKETPAQGYGVNTLVWSMKDAIAAGEYTITITDVYIIGETKPRKFTYKVEVLDIK
ncbi:MAG TPA: CAP domain-containing protein, partial [Bacteroidia bacterium]|nr:CAP domain-containing protein [Bacteroidia bacterium]